MNRFMGLVFLGVISVAVLPGCSGSTASPEEVAEYEAMVKAQQEEMDKAAEEYMTNPPMVPTEQEVMDRAAED